MRSARRRSREGVADRDERSLVAGLQGSTTDAAAVLGDEVVLGGRVEERHQQPREWPDRASSIVLERDDLPRKPFGIEDAWEHSIGGRRRQPDRGTQDLRDGDGFKVQQIQLRATP